jgi:hypothetical protein
MACRTCNTEGGVASAEADPTERRHGRGRGFSLVEALIASTVLAMAVIGISLPLAASHRQATAVRDQNLAVILAKQLLEEISAKPLCDKGAICHPGPEVGESKRFEYDSADDYHGYRDDTESMKDLAGNPLPFGPGHSFKREVTVEYRLGPSGPPALEADYALLSVQVRAPGGHTVTICRLLTKQHSTF